MKSIIFHRYYCLVLVSLCMLFSPIVTQAQTDCQKKYNGQCMPITQGCFGTHNPQNTYSLGSGYNCSAWPPENCCVSANTGCSLLTDGLGSCKSAADCPYPSTTYSNKGATDQICKTGNSATPICCVENESSCVAKGGSCRNSCESDEESPIEALNKICNASGAGTACCFEKEATNPNTDPSECTSLNGTCVTKCSTDEGKVVLDDKGACSKANTSKIVCCKNSDGSTPSDGEFTPGDDSNKQSFSYKKFIEANSFTELILSILSAIRGVVGWLAVIMIVAGGMMYMMSAGSHMTEMAKATITWAMIGFAIAVAAPTIINELYTLISTGGSSGSATFPDAKTIPEILASVLSFLLLSVGILALIGFIISGVLFVTSAGNSSQADSARKAMVYTIIGVVVSGAGLIIVTQILSLLGGQS